MKKISKQLLSILLAVVMIVSIVPVGMITANAATTCTRDEAVNWANSQARVNAKLDYDGYPEGQPYQCVDLAAFYLRYIGAAGLIGGDASAYLNKSLPSGWKYVYSNYQPGDIALWPANVSYYYDKYGRIHYAGHIGIIDSADSVGFNCIEQNYNYKYYVTKNWHYNSVLSRAIRPNWKTKPNPAPAATTPKVSVNYADVAVGKNVTFSWSSSNAVKYEYELRGPSGNVVKSANNYTSTSLPVTLGEVGEYSFKVSAYNKDNKASSYSEIKKCTSHAKVKVQFVDWDDSPITNEQLIDWNSSATAPASPSRKGYTFQGWDGVYANVKENRVIKAKYKINTYTVNFLDKAGNILKSEKVDYNKSATPPADTNNPTGYVFLGWSSEEYKNVYTEASNKTINVQGIYSWFNDDLPVVCEITSAKREDDGYYVNFDLTNYDKDVTRGRAVVSLKTAQGKLVDTTESTAFSIPKNGTKRDVEVYVPCDKAAVRAEVIIVNSYSLGVPISENVSSVIDQGLSWSEWSPVEPDPNNEYLATESRTEYRYKTRLTTTSYSTALDGWAKDGYTEVKADSGTIDFIKSGDWPRDASTGAIISSTKDKLAKYNKSEITSSENDTTKVVASSAVNRYVYWHWCFGDNQWINNGDRTISDCKETYWQTFHSIEVSSPLSYNNRAKAFSKTDKNVCNTTYWWDSYNCNSNRQLPIYRNTWTKYNKLYSYHKPSDWTEWSTDQKTEFESKEERTAYRYKDNSIATEDNTGVVRTASGQLDSSFAGKQITLYVYGYIGASDFTNYYIGQSVVANDGSYSFTYKLREEPTELTGDYTIAIGIEGTTNTIVIDTIEAPKPKYTVNFYDWDGTIISSQQVTQGQDAVLPENPTREGYDFQGWDKSVVNVQEDLDVFSDFTKKEYEVIFVDWNAQLLVVEKYQHGETLRLPEFANVKGYTFEGWDQIENENTVVTGNMVVAAEYKINTYTVKFYDFDGNVIDTQQVEYGSEAKAPETVNESADGKQFAGWFNPEEYEYVDSDLNIHPAYFFEETAETPTANHDSGEYSDTINLTLTSTDSNAVIFYYLNGDVSTEKIYTKPITVEKTCSVTYYATCLGKNDSVEQTNYYCINNSDKPSEWMLYSQIPQEVKDNIGDYNLESEAGYRYKNVETTSDVNQANYYLHQGWTLQNESYGNYSPWQDEPIAIDNSKIGFEVDTQQAPDTSVTRYQYSHYKYNDNGTTKYAPQAVAGFDCQYETVILDNRLSIAGFTENEVTYYNYNGSQWFSQTKVNGEKTQYRSRYKIAEYYQWTKWDITAPTSNETREYEENDVYRYYNVKYHIVNIDFRFLESDGFDKTLLVKEGRSLDLSELARTGNTLEGIYLNDEYTDEIDMNAPIMQSVNIYPKYVPISYNVTFQMVDGTEIDTQSVDYLCAATAPAADAVPGYVFVGWDKNFDIITEDTIVTGRYVKESEYARVSLDKTELSMYQGNSILLNATITPANLADSELAWASSDSSIATVDDKGIVTAIGYGEVTITATVIDTNETASCTINVHKDSSNSIILNSNSKLNYDALGYLRRIAINTKSSDVSKEFDNKAASLKFFNISGTEIGADSNVGTGTQIKLYNGGNVSDTKTIVITGDLTGDGIINNRDAVFAARVVVKKQNASEPQELAMDVNGDGKINNRDVAMIARYLVGKEAINN